MWKANEWFLLGLFPGCYHHLVLSFTIYHCLQVKVFLHLYLNMLYIYNIYYNMYILMLRMILFLNVFIIYFCRTHFRFVVHSLLFMMNLSLNQLIEFLQHDWPVYHEYFNIS